MLSSKKWATLLVHAAETSVSYTWLVSHRAWNKLLHAIHGNIYFHWRRKVVDALRAFGCLHADTIYVKWRQAACKHGCQLELLSKFAYSFDPILFEDLYQSGSNLMIDVPSLIWESTLTCQPSLAECCRLWKEREAAELQFLRESDIVCRWIDRSTGVLREAAKLGDLSSDMRRWLPPSCYAPNIDIDLDVIRFDDGDPCWSLPLEPPQPAMTFSSSAILRPKSSKMLMCEVLPPFMPDDLSNSTVVDLCSQDAPLDNATRNDIDEEYALDFTVPLCTHEILFGMPPADKHGKADIDTTLPSRFGHKNRWIDLVDSDRDDVMEPEPIPG